MRRKRNKIKVLFSFVREETKFSFLNKPQVVNYFQYLRFYAVMWVKIDTEMILNVFFFFAKLR